MSNFCCTEYIMYLYFLIIFLIYFLEFIGLKDQKLILFEFFISHAI
jgi:hypothetical protein